MAATSIPEDNRYAKTHEYAHPEGEVAVIGISDFAQKELGDVVLVELPRPGTQLEANEELGSIESVNAAGESHRRRCSLLRSRRWHYPAPRVTSRCALRHPPVPRPRWHRRRS